jgi:hypothetical protein
MSPEPEPVYQYLMTFPTHFPPGLSYYVENGKVYLGSGWNKTEITEENYERWGFKKVQTSESRIAWCEWRIAQLEDHINQNWANV